MFSARGSANLLTRTTTILAVVFFITSLALALLAKQQSGAPSILDLTGEESAPATGAALPDLTEGDGNLLDQLQNEFGGANPSPPSDDAAVPAAPRRSGAPEVPSGN